MEQDLVCPRDRSSLQASGGLLVCAEGHRYPFVNDIPVMLVEDLAPTQPEHWASAEQIEVARASAPPPTAAVDPVVSRAIVRTQGNLYRGIANRLPRYPIPGFPPISGYGNGRSLLDVGCNWGRWTIAAFRAGYRPLGVDSSFEGLLAARRVASQLGLRLRYVCADARRLPFASASFDVAFSYSVLQHFARDDVDWALDEIARVLRPGGTSWIQMPSAFGARNLYQQARRGFRRARGFEVRYWTPSALRAAFARIGPTRLRVDGFFTLNPQLADLDLLPRRYRMIVTMSEALRRLSLVVPTLVNVADSLIAVSSRSGGTDAGAPSGQP